LQELSANFSCPIISQVYGDINKVLRSLRIIIHRYFGFDWKFFTYAATFKITVLSGGYSLKDRRISVVAHACVSLRTGSFVFLQQMKHFRVRVIGTFVHTEAEKSIGRSWNGAGQTRMPQTVYSEQWLSARIPTDRRTDVSIDP
jgi:hypothetical protein